MTTRRAIEAMRALVTDLDSQHRRESAAFDDGFRAGFAAALDVARERDEAAWRRAATARWPHLEPAAGAARWTVRGARRTRATFALPHPDDYTGGPVEWPPAVTSTNEKD